MKNNQRLYIAFALVMLLLGFVSCSDSGAGDDGFSGGSEMSSGGVCTEWNAGQSYVQGKMKNVVAETQDENCLAYSNAAGIKTVYSFRDDKLIASAVVMPSNEMSESKMKAVFNKYEYIGDVNNTKVYTQSAINTMASLSKKNVDAKEYYVVGFAPIESDMYDSIPATRAITESAAVLGAYSVKMSGIYVNVGDDCKMGFQYSLNEDMTNCKEYSRSVAASGLSATITGLKMGTTYYYRAYAIVNKVYYYGATMSFTTEQLPTYKVGDLYPDDVNPEGVVFYTASDGASGKIVSLDTGYGMWDTNGFFGKRYYCTSSVNGASNKIPVNQPYGEWVKKHGTEWYGPAKNELTALSDVITTVNATLVENGYSKIEGCFWSSTENSTYYSQAYVVCVAEKGYMVSANGTVFSNSKDVNRSFLAVKSF